MQGEKSCGQGPHRIVSNKKKQPMGLIGIAGDIIPTLSLFFKTIPCYLVVEAFGIIWQYALADHPGMG